MGNDVVAVAPGKVAGLVTRCMSCDREMPPDQLGRTTGKRKLFCDEACGVWWWNSQPEHPFLEKIGADWADARQLKEDRAKLVVLEKADPWRYGYQPPHWQIADERYAGCSEMLLSGGNRAGKTLWAARKVVEALLSGENRNVLCCHTSSATSITVQQPAIYQYLPVELKGTKKGKIHYLNYSRKNGFTDGSFILPNGSRCDFLNYTQNEHSIEGREADLVWCDELVPQLWVDTLRFRLVTRRGKLIVTQTPLEGVASVYKEFSAGGRVVRWDDAELLSGKAGLVGWPTGKAPRVVECMSKSRVMVFFFTSDNPYSPYDEIKAKLKEAPVGQILVRAYGWATDSIGKAFARFRADVHVIKRDAIPKGGTLYMVTDPAGARNWFCLWALVYADGKMVVVREFPDLYGYGEWFLPSDKADGKVGPAQTVGAGRGTYEYRELFRTMEEDIGRGEPMMRLIDPKAGGTPALSEQGGTTLIDMLAEDGFGDAGMSFVPAPGVPVDQRMAAINSALSFDGSKPLTPINEPKLYIVDDCQNLIMSLSEHVGSDGQKGASKDPIDCLGMLLTSRLEHVGPNGMQTVGGGSY